MTNDSVEWNSTDGATGDELLGVYETLREACPVAHSDDFGGFWSVFRYGDIAAAAKNPETYLSDQPFVERRGSPPMIPLSLNGERHLYFRKLLAPYFTPARIKLLEPRIRTMVTEHLQPLLTDGEGDFSADFAYPLPARVLCAVLNVPDEEWVQFKELSKAAEEAAGATPAHQQAVAKAFMEKGLELVATRRETPHDPKVDLLTRLLEEGLDDETIASIGWQLLAAGHSTTTRALSVAAHHLATHPEDQDALRAEPARIPTAVEELLRIGPPLHHLARTVARDVQLQGCPIPAGELVALSFASGNFDERQFPDAKQIELARSPNRHLTFGIGPHICIGAPVARLELRLTLEELLARTERFELAGQPVSVSGMKSGYSKLPLRAR
jgi:cytochrome P450